MEGKEICAKRIWVKLTLHNAAVRSIQLQCHYALLPKCQKVHSIINGKIPCSIKVFHWSHPNLDVLWLVNMGALHILMVTLIKLMVSQINGALHQWEAANAQPQNMRLARRSYYDNKAWMVSWLAHHMAVSPQTDS